MYGGTTDTKHHRKGPLGRFSSINTRNIYLHGIKNNVTILDVICSWWKTKFKCASFFYLVPLKRILKATK